MTVLDDGTAFLRQINLKKFLHEKKPLLCLFTAERGLLAFHGFDGLCLLFPHSVPNAVGVNTASVERVLVYCWPVPIKISPISPDKAGKIVNKAGLTQKRDRGVNQPRRCKKRT
ncbi:MAG: hypothetical protein ACK5ME_11800 [Parahaliea sp.]